MDTRHESGSLNFPPRLGSRFCVKLYIMAKKRTKTDKLQRNVERLEKRDDAGGESEINDKRSQPPSKTPDPTEREAETEILGTQRKASAA